MVWYNQDAWLQTVAREDNINSEPLPFHIRSTGRQL